MEPVPIPQIEAKPTQKMTIKGPKGLPLLGVLPGLIKNPFEYLVKTGQTYPGIVKLPVLGLNLYLVTEPEQVRHILVGNQRNYWKGPMLGRAKFLLGNGLATSEGEFWKNQRRLMQPAFAHQKIATLAGDVTARILRMLDEWEISFQNKPFLADREMLKLTMDISAHSMFGESIGSKEGQELGMAVNKLQQHLNYRVFTFFLPESFPLPGATTALQILKRLDDMAYRLIRQRREKPTQKNDLLNLLLEMKDEDTGEGMSDRQLRDEIITLFVAGYDTTSMGLAWAWHLLSQHPEIEEKFHREIDTVLNGRIPTFEDYPKLEYTRRIFQEALRYYPPVWIFFRTNFEADIIDDYAIPENSPILLCPYVTHRNPAYWETPEIFNPDHFLAEKVRDRPKFAFFPFGGGGRQCIGEGFAYMKAVFTLAMIGQKYRLKSVPGHKVKPHSAPGLQPKYGIKMTLEARNRG
ncbi:MAG: cytochrome P450 [Bacteroidia bacterium]|nr:cytochrome P450 [Bacteroidia bacterium]